MLARIHPPEFFWAFEGGFGNRSPLVFVTLLFLWFGHAVEEGLSVAILQGYEARKGISRNDSFKLPSLLRTFLMSIVG